MPREYARITTSIWRDEDFRALTPEQQALYFLLDSQADVSAAGTLPLTIRRWAKLATGWTVARIEKELLTLAERGHVVVDDETMELLIVKFVKFDGGITNEKRRPVIRRDAEAVESAEIRRALAIEIARLGYTGMASDLDPNALTDSASDTAPDSASPPDRNSASDSPSNPLPDALSPSEGVVGSYVRGSLPQPSTLNPQPASPPATEAASRRELALVDSATPTTQTIVAEWIDRCRKRPPSPTIGQMAKSIEALLAEGIDADDVRRGIAAWTTKGLHPSTLPSVVNEVMNSGGRSRNQNETDAMFERAAQRLGVAP